MDKITRVNVILKVSYLLPVCVVLLDHHHVTGERSEERRVVARLLVSHLCVLVCPCVVHKAMAHAETKTLNMRHQAQKGFCGIFFGIPEHQKGYLVYVPSTRKIISSYDVVFDESFSSALAYTSRPYSEAMAMCPAVTYKPYATSSKEQTGYVITFAQFEEGNILTQTSNNAESGDDSDSESIMMIEQDMENISSGDDQIMISYLRICQKTFVTEVRPIRTLTEEKHVIKYVIVLGKDNQNGKER